jgi:hypothetical protein
MSGMTGASNDPASPIPKTLEDFARSLVKRWRSHMTAPLLDYLTAYAGDERIRLEHEGDWIPPNFGDVDSYTSHMSLQAICVPFGLYNGRQMTLYPGGRVDCWGDDSFRDEGFLIITLKGAKVREHVRVIVLGNIAGFGTAVLVDKTQRVWIYNPDNVVDEYIDKTSRNMAAIVMNPGSTMKRTTEWELLEVHENCNIEFDEPEDESE